MSAKEHRKTIENWVKKDPSLKPPQILKKLHDRGVDIKRPLLYHYLTRWGVFKSNRFVWDDYKDAIVETLNTNPTISLEDLAGSIFKGKTPPFHYSQLERHLKQNGVMHLWSPHKPLRFNDAKKDIQNVLENNPKTTAVEMSKEIKKVHGQLIKNETMRLWIRKVRGPLHSYTHNAMEKNKSTVTRVYNKNPKASLDVLRLILKDKGIRVSNSTLMRTLHEWGLRPSTTKYHKKKP